MKNKVIISLLVLGILIFGISANLSANLTANASSSLQISSRGACLMDYNSGTILYEKDSNLRRPIASMVKIMTLLLCLEEVEKGNIDVNSQIQISSNAASMGGSQAFLDANQSYVIHDLIKTITIASANDSCVAMAEHISGSVESFVDRMNQRASELGLLDTLFVNCTGLPAPNQYSSAHDVAVMTRALISHELYFKYSTIWMDKLTHASGRETVLANTNKLIRAYNGCDGGKTGFTNDAMFCLSATAKRNDMRLISVILGGNDSKTRFGECAKLLNYGFANFENKQVIFKGVQSENTLVVKKGIPQAITYAPKTDFFIFGAKGTLKDSIKLHEELFTQKAPIAQGDEVGKITVIKDGQTIGEVMLVATQESRKEGYNDVLNRMFKRMANMKQEA